MAGTCAHRMRRGYIPFCRISMLTILVWTAAQQFAAAQTTLRVVRVEEDWELVVRNPDPNTAAPQVTCVISPYQNIDSVYGVFELNHQTRPKFEAGGMQLQVWLGGSPVDWHKNNESGAMSRSAETVRWTQSMWLSNDKLYFQIINGVSTTWGDFGGQGNLKEHVKTELSNLNGYDPSISVGHSGVGFASNRVESLILKRVRVFLANGQVVVDDAPRVVFPYN